MRGFVSGVLFAVGVLVGAMIRPIRPTGLLTVREAFDAALRKQSSTRPSPRPL
jgi:hypothetical protein